MERPIGKCFFCGKDIFTKDLKRDNPRAVQFNYDGKMRFGCLAHPGVDSVFRGKSPEAPPSRKHRRNGEVEEE